MDGLVPPVAGCAWQLRQLSELNRGPSPASVSGIVPVTDWISENASKPASKNFASLRVNPETRAPAPAAPPRNPGSKGPSCIAHPNVIEISKTQIERYNHLENVV